MTETLSKHYQDKGLTVSKNLINDTLLLTRRARVIETLKSKSLATAVLSLNLPEENPFREAILLCDMAYLQEIINLSEPFDLEEATIALYDSTSKINYIRSLISRYKLLDE